MVPCDRRQCGLLSIIAERERERDDGRHDLARHVLELLLAEFESPTKKIRWVTGAVKRDTKTTKMENQRKQRTKNSWAAKRITITKSVVLQNTVTHHNAQSSMSFALRSAPEGKHLCEK